MQTFQEIKPAIYINNCPPTPAEAPAPSGETAAAASASASIAPPLSGRRRWRPLAVGMLALLLLAGGSLLLRGLLTQPVAIRAAGQTLAVVAGESAAEEALDLARTLAQASLSDNPTAEISFGLTPQLGAARDGDPDPLPAAEAAPLLLDGLEPRAPAVQLYVNGQAAFFLANEEAAREAIAAAKDHFGRVGEDLVQTVTVIEQVSLQPAVAPCDQIISARQGVELLLGRQSPDHAPAPALITVQVERQASELAPLPRQVVRHEDPEQLRGVETVLNAGQDGLQELTWLVREENGVETGREQIKAKALLPAEDRVVEIGSKLVFSSRGQTSAAIFGWPLTGDNWKLSSGFGQRSSGSHSGIDITDELGSPIYAASAGTVSRAEAYFGYGNLVILDHDNGLQTYYAHVDQMLVKVGDQVERGDQIATLGLTGRTSGPHVHFEVRVDGTAVDPLLYAAAPR